MKAQLTDLGGVLGGRVQVFSQQEVVLGRHPKCEVQFDPQRDIEVSTRHAMLYRHGPDWMIRDLDSRNGTLVNGHPILAPTRLADIDHVQLGPNGPRLEFRLVADSNPDTIPGYPIPSSPRATGGTGFHIGHHGHARQAEGVTARVQIEVARKTRRLRATVYVLVAGLVAALAGVAVVNRIKERERTESIAQLQALIDSVLAVHTETVRGLEGEVEGLATALRQSQRDLRDLRSQLAEAEASGNREQVAELRRQLTTAMATIAQQQSAAEIDHVRIRRENQRAVVLVWVEFPDGEVVSGSGFAVREDGTLVTGRHVVLGAAGDKRPRRIAVQFADSDQAFVADLIAATDVGSADVAILRPRLVGTVPIVTGVNARPDTVQVGAPVVMLGFPFGTDLPMTPGRVNVIASTTLTAGVVSRMLPDQIQILGYGAEGASGSPVFDRDGTVIGVLFGGAPDSSNRIVYAVPSNVVLELLATVP